MLTDDQRAFYNDNGYVLVSGLITKEEAAALRTESHELATRLSAKRNIDVAWGSGKEAVKGAENARLLHCHDVQFQSALFSRLLMDERVRGPASQIIGSP